MTVLLLTEDDVRRLLTMDMALEAVEEALRRLALDEAQNIPRTRAQTDHVMLHVLSAAAKTFGVVDRIVQTQLLRWARRKHSNKSRGWLKPSGTSADPNGYHTS